MQSWISPTIRIVVSLGALFGLLGSFIAYIILYREYLHHFPDKAKPRRLALQGAVTTFVVFFVLSILFGYAAQALQIF